MKQFKLFYDEGRRWLADVVITDDGFFAAVSDYGNFAFSWNLSDTESMEDFLLKLNVDYVACKMATSIAYTAGCTKKIDRACSLFAEHVLPKLQEEIRKQNISNFL